MNIETNNKDYKYDVAFSFVKEDESLATAINDLLQERVSTFLYSKKQEEIAGTDGEESFNKIFAEESRIVVILFRNEWGKTAWTRIEETAIRNRAFEEGYDFVIFAPVEKDAILPKWLPKNQLWIGLERWGVTGAATVIEARIQQAGGSPREETFTDRAVRLKRQMDAETARKSFLDSIQGADCALKTVQNLFNDIEKNVSQVQEEAGLTLKIERNKCWIEICTNYGCIDVTWNYSYSNTLNRSFLSVSLWNGPPARGSRMFNNSDRLQEVKYNFDRDYIGSHGWRNDNHSDLIPNQQLAERCLKILIDYTHKEHINRD